MKEENVFEKMGRRQRERKEKWTKASNKYWKLPALERIHYDSISDKINKNSDKVFIITWNVTKIYTIAVLTLMAFCIFGGSQSLEMGRRLIPLLIIYFFNFFPLLIILDILLALFSLGNRNKKIKKLNQKFKLE